VRLCALGRVSGFRVASKSLVFVDFVQDGKQVQIMLNRGRMSGLGATDEILFKKFYHLLRRGDIICTAYPIHDTLESC
jgi:lysyl-tRNA synthetase class II